MGAPRKKRHASLRGVLGLSELTSWAADFACLVIVDKVIQNVSEDLTPEHLDVAANYDAKRGVDTSCKQEYRVDFSNFNEEIEIPDLETIKSEYGL